MVSVKTNYINAINFPSRPVCVPPPSDCTEPNEGVRECDDVRWSGGGEREREREREGGRERWRWKTKTENRRAEREGSRERERGGSQSEGSGEEEEEEEEEENLTARVEEIRLLSVCQFDRRETGNSWGPSLRVCVRVCVCVCKCVCMCVCVTAKTDCPVCGL